VRPIANVPSFDGVLVDVLEVLPQRLLTLDDLRMASFLPQLERSIALMPHLMVLQAVEQGANLAFAEVVDDPPGRIRLEVADLLRQVFGEGDEVDVVLEDDVTQERQAVLVLQNCQESSKIWTVSGLVNTGSQPTSVHVKK
jgi:hypothetical protein